MVEPVLESSCTCVYIPVLRAVSPRTSSSKARFERGLLRDLTTCNFSNTLVNNHNELYVTRCKFIDNANIMVTSQDLLDAMNLYLKDKFRELKECSVGQLIEFFEHCQLRMVQDFSLPRIQVRRLNLPFADKVTAIQIKMPIIPPGRSASLGAGQFECVFL